MGNGRYLNRFYVKETDRTGLKLPLPNGCGNRATFKRRLERKIDSFLRRIGYNLGGELPMRDDEDRVGELREGDYRIFRKF